MWDPPVAPEAQPAGLLDDHLALIRHSPGTALPATAIRNRSIEARLLLARGALGDAGTLAGLLTAAREGNGRWLHRIRRRVQPDLLAGLAQTLALQDMLPTDQRDALALYELIRTTLGPHRLAPGHQGLHAQLALLAGDLPATRALLRQYPQMRPQALAEVQTDLLNPFTGVPGRPVQPWLDAFGGLLPPPATTLSPPSATASLPFDRLVAGAVERVDGPQRVSVIVTAFRPDEGLITAVRSVLAQSWRNVEVIIVDDASPSGYDPVLHRCLALGERIRLVKLPANAGTYAARNAGLDAAEGEFVTFQDSDDWSHPRRLELQVHPLLADPRLVASTSDGMAVTADLLLTRLSVRSGRFNPSSLLVRRDAVLRRIGYFDPVRKAADSEYVGRLVAAFGERALHHVDVGPLALIRLSPDSLSRTEVRPFWMHPARVAYSSAYLSWHEQIVAGANPYRPRDGAGRPFAAPEHLRAAPGAACSTRAYDAVVIADWRLSAGTQLSAVDEVRALTVAGLRVAVAHLESYRTVLRGRLPLARPIQQLINDGTVDQVFLYEPLEVALVVVRHPTVLQFPSDEACELRARRVLIVADQAPARGDGADRRYLPGPCTRAAQRMFGVPPLWCPQDGGVRAALRDLPVAELTDFDLPPVVDAQRWSEPREGAAPGLPVVGTDLCDTGGRPVDLDDALAVHRRLGAVDVRVRLPYRPGPGPAPRLPAAWLVYAAGDLDIRSFLHQLDIYLHFPHPDAVETISRPVLEAAAAGCVVMMPERFAAAYGAAAVYCGPGEAAEQIRRYHGDRALFAEQSRLARTGVAEAHDPRLFVDRVVELIRGARASAPLQRTPAVQAEAGG